MLGADRTFTCYPVKVGESCQNLDYNVEAWLSFEFPKVRITVLKLDQKAPGTHKLNPKAEKSRLVKGLEQTACPHSVLHTTVDCTHIKSICRLTLCNSCSWSVQAWYAWWWALQERSPSTFSITFNWLIEIDWQWHLCTTACQRSVVAQQHYTKQNLHIPE